MGRKWNDTLNILIPATNGSSQNLAKKAKK